MSLPSPTGSFGPEPWIDALQCEDMPDSVDQAAQDLAMSAATEVLWALSGRRFGVMQVSVRPCRRSCEPVGFVPVTGWTVGWLNCGQCGTSSCGCDDPDSIRLARRPVQEVTEVLVDGVALASTAWRLDDRRDLVRIDTEPWPTCNDLNVTTGPGVFQVTYSYAEPVPSAGIIAVNALACELAKASVGADCNLPERITTLTRQGVTIGMIDRQAYLDKGRTGIYLVDLFLRTVNPAGIQRRARAYRADAPQRERRTGT